MKFGSYATNVAGSTSLDGSIDYKLKMNVPAGKLGSQLQSYANQVTGGTNVSKDIPVTIGVWWNDNGPKPTLLASDQTQQVKNAVKEEVKQTTESGKEEVKEEVKQKAREAIQEAAKGGNPKDILNNVLKGDSTKKDSTKQVEQLKNKLDNLLKKKKKN